MEMPEHDDAPRVSQSLVTQGVIVIAVVIISFTLMSQAQFIVSRVPAVAAVISSMLVELANNDRNGQGLATLTVNPLLNEVALAKANDMAAKQYFAHNSPDGLTPWHWFKEKGYAFTYAGENLAIDFNESSDVERAWMNSPTHRANIVGTQFTEIGIAVVPGTYQGHATNYVVQVFGTPSPGEKTLRTEQSTAQAPENRASTTVVAKPIPRPVRDIVQTPPPEAVALATTLPTTTQPTAVDVLGQSAGSYLATPPKAPWWYPIVRRLSW